MTAARLRMSPRIKGWFFFGARTGLLTYCAPDLATPDTSLSFRLGLRIDTKILYLYDKNVTANYAGNSKEVSVLKFKTIFRWEFFFKFKFNLHNNNPVRKSCILLVLFSGIYKFLWDFSTNLKEEIKVSQMIQ